jgi:hypothetical protein
MVRSMLGMLQMIDHAYRRILRASQYVHST